MAKVAIILSGCGVYDGSEIHEATLSLYALTKSGFDYECFAPDINQHHVVNHLTGEVTTETRNVLVESARIARGKIKPLAEYKTNNFAALLLPGGFGAAKNLSNYAFTGDKCIVNEEVEKTIIETYKAGLPIVALCIAPVIVAKVLGAEVTIGTDIKTAKNVANLGGINKPCKYNEVAVDAKYKVITTPCYMEAKNIYQVGEGIEAAVSELKKLLLK